MRYKQKLIGANMVGLSICYQHLSARINRAIEPLGMNMTQLSILSHFSRNSAREETVSSLSKVMEMNQPMVTKAVKSMVEKGWINKTVSATDARVAYLKLSDKGGEALGQAQQNCFPLLGGVFEEFDTQELITLEKLLGKLKQGLY